MYEKSSSDPVVAKNMHVENMLFFISVGRRIAVGIEMSRCKIMALFMGRMRNIVFNTSS